MKSKAEIERSACHAACGEMSAAAGNAKAFWVGGRASSPVLLAVLAGLLLMPVFASRAATLTASEPTVIDKGPQHRTWQTVRTMEVGGKVTTNIETYCELQSGLHRFDEGRKEWVETDSRIEMFQDGAVVRNLQYNVVFAPNLASLGAIDILLPDSRRLTGQIMGLSFREGTKSVLISETRDCAGEIGGENHNILTYRSAFTDIEMDVQYVVERGSFSQNLIFHERLPDPTQYGLTSLAHLELLTEWITAPAVDKQTFIVEEPHDGQNALTDERIDLGSMQFAPGKAFNLGEEDAPNSIAISKSWEQIAGRSFLIEKVPWSKIQAAFQKLPPRQARLNERPGKESLMAKEGHAIPARKMAAKPVKPIRMAQARGPEHGLAMDYDLVVSTNNFLFEAKTYYISGLVTITTNVFSAGCVVKYAPTNSAQLKITGPLTCLSTNWRPFILTARDDTSAGSAIGGASLSGYYATYALYLDYASAGSAFNVHDVRIGYANTGIKFAGGTGHVVSHAQFVGCNTAMESSSADSTLRNALLYSVGTVCSGSGASSTTSRWEHVTLDQVNNFNNTTNCTFFLTNSLLVAVTNTGPYSGANNASNTTSANVFQTVGAGAHYLLAGSQYRDAGNTNVSILPEIKNRTTWPPMLYASNSVISISTTLSPVAQRDTDIPDLGFHYAAADYGVDFLTISNATVNVAAGTVIAVYGAEGIIVRENANLVCTGTPLSTVHITPFYAIQEVSTNWDGSANPFNAYKILGFHYVTNPPTATGSFRFTQFDGMADGGYHIYDSSVFNFLSLTLQDCSLGAGFVELGSGSGQSTVLFRNNLLETVTANIVGDFSALSLYNNLWKGGAPYFDKSGDTNHLWTVKDNAFDNCNLSSDDDPFTTGNNAYINTTQLVPTNASDVVLSSFSWQVGVLGPFYQPTNSALINSGSRNSTNAGLYHFTVLTNQIKETNTIADISFHYPAMNLSTGLPYDFDGDTFPDYFEDFNGNGVFDTGETDWKTYTSLYGVGSGPGLQVFTPLK